MAEVRLGSRRWDGYFKDLINGSVKIYGDVLRPAVSSGCPSYPPCSQYMIDAVTERGFPLGLIIGLERLLHEYGEMHSGTVITTPDGPRIYDPLENNTFWWSSLHID
ncbi:membrane protein insertion efficiency factor YidD [bacterium]|nr:membrane protein insertion efficiency factor YidD [candidate division CSSED10-310 bacterium]